MRTAFAFLLSALTASAATTNQIVVREITWQFDAEVEYGQFVNGEYWVVTPVTVTNMLPEWDGTYHGWEVNPLHVSAQGFTTMVDVYDATKRPAMPFTITTNASLVKTKGGPKESSHSEIEYAEVLTFLTEAPPNGGTNYFRPPYAGTNKPLYQVSDLQTNLLPSLSTNGVTSIPTLDWVVTKYSQCLRMDHNPNRARQLRPWRSMGDYMPENTQDLNNAMLRLMLDDPIEDKMPALIQFAQHALDRAYIIQMGYRQAGTGHNPNQRIVAAFGAVIFGITEIQNYLTNASGFHEDTYLYYSDVALIPLWGETATESDYWEYIATENGSRSKKDPYGYIDGGKVTSYLIITAQSLKGQALVGRLFPETAALFYPGKFDILNEFAERWTVHGKWTLPDPAAPYDGAGWPGNYGVTYGPDGAGGFITNGGRFPTLHGTYTDDGQYKSAFVASMWVNHAGSLFEDDAVPSVVLNLAGDPDLDQVSLTWNRPQSDYYTITNYLIYRGPDTNSLELLATIAPGFSYTDTTISPFTAYAYGVSSINQIGQSDTNIIEVSSVPLTGVIGPRGKNRGKPSNNASGGGGFVSP